jgi:hypothetical protein
MEQNIPNNTAYIPNNTAYIPNNTANIPNNTANISNNTANISNNTANIPNNMVNTLKDRIIKYNTDLSEENNIAKICAMMEKMETEKQYIKNNILHKQEFYLVYDNIHTITQTSKKLVEYFNAHETGHYIQLKINNCIKVHTYYEHELRMMDRTKMYSIENNDLFYKRMISDVSCKKNIKYNWINMHLYAYIYEINKNISLLNNNITDVTSDSLLKLFNIINNTIFIDLNNIIGELPQNYSRKYICGTNIKNYKSPINKNIDGGSVYNKIILYYNESIKQENMKNEIFNYIFSNNINDLSYTEKKASKSKTTEEIKKAIFDSNYREYYIAKNKLTFDLLPVCTRCRCIITYNIIIANQDIRCFNCVKIQKKCVVVERVADIHTIMDIVVAKYNAEISTHAKSTHINSCAKVLKIDRPVVAQNNKITTPAAVVIAGTTAAGTTAAETPNNTTIITDIIKDNVADNDYNIAHHMKIIPDIPTYNLSNIVEYYNDIMNSDTNFRMETFVNINYFYLITKKYIYTNNYLALLINNNYLLKNLDIIIVDIIHVDTKKECKFIEGYFYEN